MDVAVGGSHSFSFAWVSDTHLYPRKLNTRFIETAKRALEEVQEMGSQFDFMIFGGDLAQLGDPVEIKLGAELLEEVTIKKYFVPGEHDWFSTLVNPGIHISEKHRGLLTTRVSELSVLIQQVAPPTTGQPEE